MTKKKMNSRSLESVAQELVSAMITFDDVIISVEEACGSNHDVIISVEEACGSNHDVIISVEEACGSNRDVIVSIIEADEE
ncbi:hypothetical protein F511_39239 [Dorcoceras hygrometricum]|uniref:Uncharacterized protein n=1 Tax=Dorcoceras hygrometricum TaxID=472368 RepID=A0A2Z7CGH2_9LAMI|nr:hypothetical protein F511_39239 [Dorcoceras hygrometricum]